jgi:catechol 2,3-dioxygenase-like lactoylglutathione lyase family enzyme
MIKPRRVGHATFETPDLEKAIAYYDKFMGLVVAEREKDRAFLATKIGQLVIELNKADRAHCIKLAFEVAPNSDFGELARELSKDGVRSELRNDSIPGMGQVLSFKDDKGTTIDLFKDWSYLGKHAQVAGIGPLKLGHVAFFTPDIQRTVSFYEKVLGFRVSDWIGDFFCFMRCNTDHHTVNFFTGPDVKLHHIAFELKDFMHLQNSCEIMGQQRVPIIWGPLRHGPGHNVATYHRNPDDQVVEFFCELDQMVDEELGYFEPRPWHHDTPQRPKLWTPGKTTVWGPTPEDDFHRTQVR